MLCTPHIRMLNMWTGCVLRTNQLPIKGFYLLPGWMRKVKNFHTFTELVASEICLPKENFSYQTAFFPTSTFSLLL